MYVTKSLTTEVAALLAVRFGIQVTLSNLYERNEHLLMNETTVENMTTIGSYQPQPSASADNTYLDLDYFGYHKNLIQ